MQALASDFNSLGGIHNSLGAFKLGSTGILVEKKQ
jgi:hypothetical protein